MSVLLATTAYGAKARPQILTESNFRTLKNATNDTFHLFNCSKDPTNLIIESLWSEPPGSSGLPPTCRHHQHQRDHCQSGPTCTKAEQRRYRHQLALEPIDNTTHYTLPTGLIEVARKYTAPSRIVLCLLANYLDGVYSTATNLVVPVKLDQLSRPR